MTRTLVRLILLAATLAWADDQQAKELYLKALEQKDAGQYAEALASIQASETELGKSNLKIQTMKIELMALVREGRGFLGEYQRFIDLGGDPSSIEVQTAHAMKLEIDGLFAQEDKEFTKCSGSYTKSPCEAYLSRYPRGRYADRARMQMRYIDDQENLRWKAQQQEKERKEYVRITDRSKWNDWQRDNPGGAARRFLEDYPSSQYAPEVRVAGKEYRIQVVQRNLDKEIKEITDIRSSTRSMHWFTFTIMSAAGGALWLIDNKMSSGNDAALPLAAGAVLIGGFAFCLDVGQSLKASKLVDQHNANADRYRSDIQRIERE